MPNNEDKKQYTAGSALHWLTLAMSDLSIAKIEPQGDIRLESLCFHAQQAVEKAIKAIFVHYGVKFPFTHDLSVLVSLLDDINLSLPKGISKEDIAELNIYAVETRYPSLIEITEDDYHQALLVAQKVVEWAKQIIDE